jgi:hypothetical protein
MKAILNTNLFKELLAKNISHLADGYYGRSHLLAGIQLNSYKPKFDFYRSLCDEKTVELHNRYTTEWLRIKLSNGGYQSDYYKNIQKDYLKRVETDISAAPTRYLEIEEQYNLNHDTRPYWQETLDLRKEEIGHYVGHDRNVTHIINKDIAYSTYCNTMAAVVGNIGFKHDRRLSSNKVCIFSKPMAHNYVIAFHIDKLNLFTSLDEVESDLEENRSLGNLELNFCLTHVDNKRLNDSLSMIWYENNDFFPIEDTYKYYRSLRELEFLIKAHIAMYSLIQDEFETAIKNTLNE